MAGSLRNKKKLGISEPLALVPIPKPTRGVGRLTKTYRVEFSDYQIRAIKRTGCTVEQFIWDAVRTRLTELADLVEGN